MSTLVRHRSGTDDIRGPLYTGIGSLVDAGPLLSLAPSVEAYRPPLKKPRVRSPFILQGVDEETPLVEPKRVVSLDSLPDECLFEILRRIPGKQERSVTACVSKRWLMLLSSIRTSEADGRPKCRLPDLNKDAAGEEIVGTDSVREFSRYLEGNDATDMRLASLAIKSGAGLGKLSIRSSNTTACGVTNLGLKAIARCCPSLGALMIWNAPFVGDDGLAEIAEGCPLLEKLDLCQCPLITDKGLTVIAVKCPNLVSLVIESCSKISNEGLQAFSRCCLKLQVISISNCPLVGDQGISSMISSASTSLRKIKLQNLNITDASVAVVGYYGREVTDLVFSGLQNVGEKGFWVMGKTNGLNKLTNFTISSCVGLTNLGFEAVAKGCPVLKQVCIRNCPRLFDSGLESFSAASSALESLRLEECDKITLAGIFVVLVNCGSNLSTLSLSKCKGIKDFVSCSIKLPTYNSLCSLSIHDCPGFGSASMALIGKICPQLQNINLRGLPNVRDEGLLSLIHGDKARLVKVNLSGCSDLSDVIASSIVKIHGSTLETLNLGGCKKISDATLLAIAENCAVLKEIDVSQSAVSDHGIAALSSAKQLKLCVMSLSRCSKVTNRSLPALANLGKSLVGINLQRCSSISTTVIAALEEKMWWCDILY